MINRTKNILLIIISFLCLFFVCSCETTEIAGPQGEKGDQGLPGNGVSSIEKTSTEGLVDTYTITFTDGSTSTFTVTNGKEGIDGAQGIQGIQGVPGKDGHTPVITIQNGNWYIDGVDTHQTAVGLKGDTGNSISKIEKTKTEGLVDTYTIYFTNGNTTTFDITNGKDAQNDHLSNEEILEIFTKVEYQELFTGFCDIDFFLSSVTLSNGLSTVIPIYSNTHNSRLAVIPMEDGLTYHIKVKNNDEDKTRRMRICTYKESLSELMIAPLGAESWINKLNPNEVSVAETIIHNDPGKGVDASNCVEYTFVNELNAKSLALMVAWGANPSKIELSVTVEKRVLNNEIEFSELLYEDLLKLLNNHQSETNKEQELILLTNILTSNMNNENAATKKIMGIAYNFWKHRDEFIFCSGTALDRPWDYWSYEGYVDSSNTGKVVSEENTGYKRIDCSTFVRYIINGIDYYSTPYFNTLENTDVEQGGLLDGLEVESNDPTICRSGKMYIRPNKTLILESKNSSYLFTKIYGYDSDGQVVQVILNPERNFEFVPLNGVCYIRAEMKVLATSDYEVSSTKAPASILKCLRIRENERLEVNAECPLSGYRNANEMCKWFEQNGYEFEFNKYFFSDNEIKVGSVIYWGRTTGTWAYKNITHTSLYIGSGYIIHVSSKNGLTGGEAITIETIEDLFERYDIPMVAISSPKYHLDD